MNQTIQNLAKAFIGESQARNRYTIYSKIAKNEGYEQIAAIFQTTADQEHQHAKWLFRMINDLKKENPELNGLDEIKVEASAPTIYESTIDNLKAAIRGESYEFTTMYPEFAVTAESEGYALIATRLRCISQAERFHEERYNKVLDQLSNGTLFKKQQEVDWVCRNCGYNHKGTKPLEKCPSCDHPMAYFELKFLVF